MVGFRYRRNSRVQSQWHQPQPEPAQQQVMGILQRLESEHVWQCSNTPTGRSLAENCRDLERHRQFSCTSQQVSAEVVLYEGTNVIEIYLGNRPQCGWGSAVVGIMNQPGTIGISPEGYKHRNWSATNEAWRFASGEAVEGTTLWYEGDDFRAWEIH